VNFAASGGKTNAGADAGTLIGLNLAGIVARAASNYHPE
jgi:hypothetical protein